MARSLTSNTQHLVPNARSSLITHHSSLVSLGRRVRARHLLASLRTGVVWAVAGGAAITVGGRLTAHPEGQTALLVWVVLALLASAALALRRWPDEWKIAVAADGLGLSERVASAVHAARSGHPAALLLEADATRVLARLDPASYSLLESTRPSRLESAAVLALALAVLLPIPTLGNAASQAAEARSVVDARQQLQALESKLKVQPEPLAQAAVAELKASEEQLAQARTASEAARILEQAQERLAGQGRAEDYAWQRALEGLTSTWARDRNLAEVARSIASGDREGLEEALSELARRAEGMSAEERQALQQSLQAGANSARDVPDLSGALREAAGQLGKSGSGSEGQGSASQGMQQVSSQIGQGMSRFAGLQAAQQAVAGLGQARAGLGQVSGSAGGASAAASGAPSGSASGAQAAGGSSSGSGSGSGSGAGSGSGTGQGSGGGSGTGGSGTGTGSGSGSGGTGGSGSGAGAGAGAGGGPAPGQPGAGNAGATTSGGNAAPSLRGATTYESIYAPSLMGGSGPRVETSGGAQGTGGETVELPNSPLELGSVRPYNEVYGQYEEAARQSLSRQPLPPSLQGVVQRYFSSIAPE